MSPSADGLNEGGCHGDDFNSAQQQHQQQSSNVTNTAPAVLTLLDVLKLPVETRRKTIFKGKVPLTKAQIEGLQYNPKVIGFDLHHYHQAKGMYRAAIQARLAHKTPPQKLLDDQEIIKGWEEGSSCRDSQMVRSMS